MLKDKTNRKRELVEYLLPTYASAEHVPNVILGLSDARSLSWLTARADVPLPTLRFSLPSIRECICWSMLRRLLTCGGRLPGAGTAYACHRYRRQRIPQEGMLEMIVREGTRDKIYGFDTF